MSTRNLLILIFWMIVLAGLLIQFLTPTPTPPTKLSLNFPTDVTPKPLVTPRPTGDYLRQSRYIFEDGGKDHPKQFLATITIQNPTGHFAKNIQVHVRPYRGADDPFGDTEVDASVDENSEVSKYGKWVAVPDLNPGDSATVTWLFDGKPPYSPADNAKPVLKYTIETGEQVVTPDYIAQQEAKDKIKKKINVPDISKMNITRKTW